MSGQPNAPAVAVGQSVPLGVLAQGDLHREPDCVPRQRAAVVGEWHQKPVTARSR